MLPLAVLGIHGGPVITPAKACTHQLEYVSIFPYFIVLTDPDGVCRGQLGEVLQGVRVGGEGGDADRGGGQLEIDDGLAVLRRTQVNTEYSEHYTSLTLTLPASHQ